MSKRGIAGTTEKHARETPKPATKPATLEALRTP